MLGKILKIKRKSLFKFSSYSHPEIREFQGVTLLQSRQNEREQVRDAGVKKEPETECLLCAGGT
jgi:phage terminase Nu1 subunit (DNA packaging protein)